VPPASLKPLPYHVALCDFLKREEEKLWDWFASNKTKREQADAVRFDLLKKTYRVEQPADPTLYEAASDAAQTLGLDVPITIYQAQSPEGLNAGLAYVPGEAHIILSGPVKGTFDATELRALMGHELAHFVLWDSWDGEHLVADQVLAALTHDEQAMPAHHESARLVNLYNEIYCDRGSLAVVHDPLVAISMLVKVTTGLNEVNAASYLRQAEEILSKEGGKSTGLTHPEAYVRARSVQLFSDGGENVEDQIAGMIEGSLTLDGLDLLQQQRVSGLTRRLMDAMLAPAWLRTELTLGHARLYFPGYMPADEVELERLTSDLKTSDAALEDYYCYVLLDFVTADRELEEAPLAAALGLVERLSLKERFAVIAKKELRLTKKQFDQIDRNRDALLSRALEEKTA
jgi:hypothetical protein